MDKGVVTYGGSYQSRRSRLSIASL
jgi:hypothetical protein